MKNIIKLISIWVCACFFWAGSFTYGSELEIKKIVTHLIGMKAPEFQNRAEELEYDWRFAYDSVSILDEVAFLKLVNCLKERDTNRFIACKDTIFELDKSVALTPGHHLIFAWKFKPEKVEIKEIKIQENLTEVVIAEKLEDSKIYSGYVGEMKIFFERFEGKFKIKNVTYDRRFSNGELWSSDLRSYLDEFSKELKKARIDTIKKSEKNPQLASPKLPIEIEKKLE